MINHVFSDIINLDLLLYMDDILVYAMTEEEHDDQVKEVLRRLQKYQYTVSPEKCVWKPRR